MNNATLIVILLCFCGSLWAQNSDTVNMYYYKNSLYNHLVTGQSEATHSTNVGNWIARFVAQADSPKSATLGSVFGFFPSWSTPPRANNFHDEISTPYLEKWTYSWTGAENINLLGFVPDNFDGQNFDPADTTHMGEAYVTKLIQLIDEWEENAPNDNRRYVVYAGWPALNSYGGTNDDPSTLTAQAISDWWTYGLGEYQDWMESLVSQMKAQRPLLNIQLHNISKAVLLCHQNTSVKNMKYSDLFEDLAPHGRANWYFLAAVAEYIELFNEKPSDNFKFQSAWGIDTAITNNYEPLVDYIWTVLKGTGSASATLLQQDDKLFFYPNPATSIIHIKSAGPSTTLSLMNNLGTMILEKKGVDQLDIAHLPSGIYVLKIQSGQTIRQATLVIE